MKRLAIAVVLAVLGLHHASAEVRYSVTGLVLKVDRSAKMIVVSCQEIPNYMEAMAMPFAVRDEKLLDHIAPGDMIGFTLVVNADDSYAEKIEQRPYQTAEQEPQQAQRLRILEGLNDSSKTVPVIKPGQSIPDFTLTDQTGKPISLGKFSGKVVALNFVYTRCPLPQYCVRLANNFGRVQERFRKKLGTDLVLLTITFDPVHDTPEILANYARTFKADSANWHFLTGPPSQVEHLTNLFGVGFWQDEATFIHSLHTAIIDRHGKLVANLEGNKFSPEQLGDLIETVLGTQK